MKRGMVFGILAIVLLSYFALAAGVVSHLAEQVRAGIFGINYTGNWSFVNGSVGIGTTSPAEALDVNG
ncbi:MAG: hypothetical protein AAB966_01235, partial [Patescibacteria group bacterium]